MKKMLWHMLVSGTFFKLPIFYLEYSGTYGDKTIVEEAKSVLKYTKLFYGGGISQ